MPNIQTLLEAVPTVTDSDAGWVSVGNYNAPVTQIKLGQAISQAKTGFYTNSVMHLLVDTQADFITSHNLMPTCPNNEAATKWISEYWDKEIYDSLDEWAREFIVLGELLCIVDKSKPWAPETISISPERINGFEMVESNPRKLARVLVSSGKDGEEENLPLFGFASESEKRIAIYMPVNKFGDDYRGAPTLMHLLDPASTFDRANVSMLSRLPALYAIWWDVTLKNFTPDQVRKWNQENGGSVPQPGSILAHNDASEWNVKSASGAARTSADWYSYYRDFLLTSGGISPTMFSGVSYRYSEANNPSVRAIARLRKRFARFIEKIITVALEATPYAGEEIVIGLPEDNPSDASRNATALSRFATSVNMALEKEIITKDEARELLVGPLQRGAPC